MTGLAGCCWPFSSFEAQMPQPDGVLYGAGAGAVRPGGVRRVPRVEDRNAQVDLISSFVAQTCFPWLLSFSESCQGQQHMFSWRTLAAPTEASDGGVRRRERRVGPRHAQLPVVLHQLLVAKVLRHEGVGGQRLGYLLQL